MNVVLGGRCVMRVGRHHYAMSPSSVLLLAPGQDHEMVSAEPELRLWVMALSPELAEVVVGSVGRSMMGLRQVSSEGLEGMLLELAEVRSKEVVETQVAKLFRQYHEPRWQHVLSRRAVEVMGTEPGCQATSLARQLHTHPSVLSRVFHEEVGSSLTEYRTRLRLLQFIRNVDEGKNLTEAAFASGFGSYAQLHRAFHRALGCAPRRFFDGERERLSAETVGEPGFASSVSAVVAEP